MSTLVANVRDKNVPKSGPVRGEKSVLRKKIVTVKVGTFL